MKILLPLLFFFIMTFDTFCQIPGEEPPSTEDSLMIFESPKPLINKQAVRGLYYNTAGLNLTFSNSGFGLGPFYERRITDNFFARIDLYISGLRNTDEFSAYNPTVRDWVIPNKVNWLVTMPLTVGISYSLLSDMLFESFKPFVGLGIGPNFLMVIPYGEYPHSFFDQLQFAKFYTRFGAYVGLGANFGAGKNATAFTVRYYYSPFGGEGIESVKGRPIQNIGGGLYLALSIGFRY